MHRLLHIHFPALSHVIYAPCSPLALVFTSRIEVLPLPAESEALKTDTSVRMGGRRLWGGGVAQDETEGEDIWGCILGPKLNEAVCSQGNPPLPVPNKTPSPSSSSPYQRIFVIFFNKEGRKEGISSPPTSLIKSCLIPTHPTKLVLPHLFSHYFVVSHALKVICYRVQIFSSWV